MNDRTIKEETEIQTLDPIEGDNLEDKDDNLVTNTFKDDKIQIFRYGR